MILCPPNPPPKFKKGVSPVDLGSGAVNVRNYEPARKASRKATSVW